jgi:class 3 adenylate cyclase
VQDERKVVSVLFCDLVGFTATSEQADPEDVRARIRPYHQRLRDEIEHYGGTVEKFVGDAVMAVLRGAAARARGCARARAWGTLMAAGPSEVHPRRGFVCSGQPRRRCAVSQHGRERP